jgi:hypothetical protein
MVCANVATRQDNTKAGCETIARMDRISLGSTDDALADAFDVTSQRTITQTHITYIKGCVSNVGEEVEDRRGVARLHELLILYRTSTGFVTTARGPRL